MTSTKTTTEIDQAINRLVDTYFAGKVSLETYLRKRKVLDRQKLKPKPRKEKSEPLDSFPQPA